MNTSYRAPDAESSAAYPFGYGLSYTTFDYAEATQMPTAECAKAAHAWKGSSPLKACIVVNVTNNGTRQGAEVVQAYVQFQPEAEMPRLMLKGFHKTAVLAPAASEPAVFAFTERDLSTYRVDLNGWKMQKSMKVHVGASSADLRTSVDLMLA